MGLKNVYDLLAKSARTITKDIEDWKNFLNTASRLYKYSFAEQLLIYAQRPDAVACASIETWNGKMRRWIKRGSKSIALIDSSSENKLKLKLVFEYSDTIPLRDARKPWLWEMRDEYHDGVMEALENRYGELDGDSIAEKLMALAEEITAEIYPDAIRDLMMESNDSFLEELDELNVGVNLQAAMQASIQYVLLTRCGLNPLDYLDNNDFRSVLNFNTPVTLYHLGNQVSQICEEVLREVAKSVAIEEKELAITQQQGYTKNIAQFNDLNRERIGENGQQRIDIQQERGLSGTGLDIGREHDGSADRQIRDAPSSIPERTSEGAIHLDAPDRTVTGAPSGDRPDSARADKPAAIRGNRAAGSGLPLGLDDEPSENQKIEKANPIQLNLHDRVELYDGQIALVTKENPDTDEYTLSIARKQFGNEEVNIGKDVWELSVKNNETMAEVNDLSPKYGMNMESRYMTLGNDPPKETRPIGDTVLMLLVYNKDGNFERTGKRVKVKIEPPIGKYSVYSREVNGSNEPYYFLLTDSGRLVSIYDAGRYGGQMPDAVTEKKIDDYFTKAKETCEKALQDPEQWVDFHHAAIANRLDEADKHNQPIRESREAARAKKAQEWDAEYEAKEAKKHENYNNRVDDLAQGIVNGSMVDTTRDKEMGKNPLFTLFERHGVELPLATKGWVNRNLRSVQMHGDGSCTMWLRKGIKPSKSFASAMQKLINAITKEMTPVIPVEAQSPETIDYFSLSDQSKDAEPSATITIAGFVRAKLESGEKFSSTELFAEATKAYGDTMANNVFSSKDAYDAMELGVNQYMLSLNDVSLEKILSTLELIPAQTKRTDGMERYQQFSTPPSIAYLASFAANIGTDDIVVEPSAGIGGIALFAKKDGATVHVNELDERRLKVLKNLPFDGFYNEDAEQINNILGDKVTPTVIVMNPPFSSSAERNIQNSKIGAKHIEEALKMLAPNGRLVAIVGQGMADDAPSFRNWWRDIKAEYNVQANLGIDGKNYNKYGTNFGIQMLVIDKNGPTILPIKTAFVENLLDLQTILGGIRNERPNIKLEEDKGNERSPATATRYDTAFEREADNGRNDFVSDTDGIADTAVAGDRHKPSITSEIDTDVGRTSDTSPDLANINDNGFASDLNTERYRGNDGRNDGDSRTGRIGVVDSGQSARSNQPLAKLPKPVKRELTDSIFEQYEPQLLLLENVQPHPANISESAAMSAIQPPPVTYKPRLSQDLIDNGILSDVQLEAVSYAGQSHRQTLPDGTTRGFFLGDGTGVGKGRTIAGIILDNYTQGRNKAVWLSENRGLIPDAKRDVKALFGDSDLVVEFQGGKRADASLSSKEAILFITYSALSKGFDQTGSNFEKIVDWLGKDFDGVIVFDEAHNMANSIASKGNRGIKKASQRGMAGLAIQEALPNAKIIYSSATGATEIENLRYAERLGLWGEGTAFANGDDFVHKIKAGGLAAMELIARDMKAMGVYLSRNISYEDVVYDKIVHELTPEQRQVYDELARSWQIVLKDINKALETTNQNKDGMAKGKVYGAFWSAEQRFFNQILTAMQVPSMIADIQTQLDNDNSIVIQLVSTNEAAQEREFTRLQEQDLDLEDFDLTPKQMLMSYIENSFPVAQFEEYLDDDGNIRSKPVYDSEGNLVINREAVRQKEILLDKLGSIKVPASALDMIINHFGSDMVAENTGRKRRVVIQDGKAREENIASKKEADVTAFQDGDKRIIVFSKAGGTGKSYHADKSAKNQQHRVHYLLQAGWQADAAVQGFGRSHRSNQASAPTFSLVTTDLKGQMRFISTIAKRLDQLGALTKGQRQTGSQGLFTAGDNLENAFASDVLAMYYKTLVLNRVDGISDGVAILEKLGLKDKLVDEYGYFNPNANELREVNKFLNRILSLECHEQNAVFDGYAERLQMATEKAMRDGTLDKGLENYRADKVVLNETQDIKADETTGAMTKYYSLTTHNKIKPLQFGNVDTHNSAFMGFYQNKNTGAVRAVFKTSSMTDEHGNITENCRLTGQDGNEYMPQNRLSSNWTELPHDKAKSLWNDAVSELPEFRTSNLHLIGGTVLPVWDKLPTENVRIYRVLTDDGDMLIGRVIPEDMIDATLHRLGATRAKENIKAEDLIKSIKNGDTVHLDNGWRITQKRVSNEQRIEVMGPDYMHSDLLAKKGVFTERISYQTRYFISAENDTAKVLDEVLKISPVSRVERKQPIQHYSSMKAILAAAQQKADLRNAEHDRSKQAKLREVCD